MIPTLYMHVDSQAEYSHHQYYDLDLLGAFGLHQSKAAGTDCNNDKGFL